ncbi:hypothetical protein OAO01_07130 [Oligoflexia bacterium]|nr:hypothetical protein [Oligoflexia bacterium]
MCFNLNHSEDSYYCDMAYKLRSSVDCSACKDMELCADCYGCGSCYWSSNLVQCSNVSNGQFCFDCHACSDVILCWNLRNKQYCVRNQQLSKEAFLAEKERLSCSKRTVREQAEAELRSHMQEDAIHRFANMLNCEDCTGDNLIECRNCVDSFDILRGEDLTRVISVDNDAKCSMDVFGTWDGAELIYESMSATKYRVLFSFNVWESSEVYYSDASFSCEHIFGCSGLKREKFCILNQRYSEQEYRALVKRLIEHMHSTGEWGEFFPVSYAPVAYNESVAREYFPLSKAEVEAYGWRWQEPSARGQDGLSPRDFDDFVSIPENISKLALCCNACGYNYRITTAEAQLYNQLELPLPAHCPDCRYDNRLAYRPPRKLWERGCGKCGAEIQTPYAPEQPEVVYCEGCYLERVF